MFPSLKILPVLLLVMPLISAATLAADPSETGPGAKSTQARVHQKKVCLVHFGGSPFAEPCDRVAEMPSTAENMHIIGLLPRAKNQ